MTEDTTDETADDGDGAAAAASADSLSRRAILSRLSAVGVGGAIVGAAGGAGLQALDLSAESEPQDSLSGDRPQLNSSALGSESNGGFWDAEQFGSASAGANVLQSGSLDLGLCWERPGEDCSPTDGPATLAIDELEHGDSGSATLRCDLEGNPAWTWLRTSCPTDACGLDRAMEVTLWYDDNCDGVFDDGEAPLSVVTTDDIVDLVNVRLCDALSYLHDGILLDANPSTMEEEPLSPDDTCCIGLSWEVVDYICEDDDDIEFDFELHAEQRRHVPEPENPWETEPCEVDCDANCPSCDFQGISFVAFCVEDGGIGDGDVTFTPVYDVEGEPYLVDWESDIPLDWVVLFYGSNNGKYFENFCYGGATEGSVRVNSPQHESKLEWNGGGHVTDYGQCPRDPAPDVGVLGNGGCGTADGTVTQYSWGCAVKYNFDDGVWDDTCQQTCPGE